MENSLGTIKNNLILEQSKLFGENYKQIQGNNVNTFNDVSINSIDDWYNSLLIKHSFNPEQVQCLHAFFKALKYVLINIDPNKLDIKDELIEDIDLMLWRESSKGISKLVFDEYGQVAYMFNGNDGSKQKGNFDVTVDMEKLLYRFISM